MSEPAWVEHAIWWHAFPLGFVGAEAHALPDGALEHRLPHLAGWIPYATELGANGLLLGPIFESSSHGYDTIDYFAIDRRLGDADDFRDLVTRAHDHGSRVLLDGVFNHVGRDFPAFREALAAGPGSAAEQWFHLYWREDGGDPDYEHFEGHRQLVTLNHDCPEVADLVVDVMCHWLGQGADGWRLDAAYAVPASFWSRVLPRVRERYPDAYIVGEMIHGDYVEYVRESGIDSVTQYELWKSIWSAVNDRNLYELDWTLTRNNALLDAFVPMTFLGNHDVTRIASRIEDGRHLPHAIALLLTLPGTPSIYAGDEQAFRGVKEDREGGDDAVRPAFPPAPDGLSADGAHVASLYRELIGVRRRHPWLHRARTRMAHLSNEQTVIACESAEGTLLTALNLAEDPALIPVPGAVAVVAGAADLMRDGPSASIMLPAHGWAILSWQGLS